MSIQEKLVQKLLAGPKKFTYDEMVRLLRGFGYAEENRGKTSGSAVMFYNKRLNDKIMFHKPHQGKELKTYVLSLIILKLKKNEMI
ncbi:MAG: type II toxin-antitoxin system HicA family toxin [Bacteroidota bacterium]